MGFMRKALFVSTGGLSGVAVRANSKKERTAKAVEKQARLQAETHKAEQKRATVLAVAAPSAAATGASNLILAAVDPSKKIATIKAVRLATGLGLREAKVIVDRPPSVVRLRGLAQAQMLKAQLEAVGATVEHQPTSDPASNGTAPTELAASSVPVELERLAELHHNGSLSDAEFAAAKSKVLGS
jgi:large subunit ribosomal protein L7/L12